MVKIKFGQKSFFRPSTTLKCNLQPNSSPKILLRPIELLQNSYYHNFVGSRYPHVEIEGSIEEINDVHVIVASSMSGPNTEDE